MRNIQGMSLLEILIILGITTIIGSILVSSLINFQQLFSQSTTQSFQGISINDAVVQISDSIKQANSVENALNINSVSYTSSSQSLILKYYSIDAQGSVINQKFDYIIITRDPQRMDVLRKYVFPDPLSSRKADNKILTTSLSQLVFYYHDNLNNIVTPASASRVSFTINLTEKSGLDFKTSSASGKANIKNL